MGRPCDCNNARQGSYSADQCLNCWKWINSSWWRDRWLSGELPASTARIGLPTRPACIHEGAVLEYSRCRGEAGHVRDCDRHDRCVRGPVTQARIQVCTDCSDYQAVEPPAVEVGAVRHCLYYVCPMTVNGVWRLRADQVKARKDLFNGKRIVAVAEGHGSGPRLDPVSAVAAHFGPGWEIVPVPNLAAKREIVAWEPLWGRIEKGRGPSEVAWFGHAKGVTKPVNPGVTCHEWARVSVEVCLDYWPLVQKELERFPITGPFKKSGAGFTGSKSSFHYSGTFYWVRCDDFFARDWRGLLDKTWWGTESYPGVAYKQDEAGCLFYPGVVPVLNLYTMKVWNKVAEEYERWRGKNAQYRSVTGSATVS